MIGLAFGERVNRVSAAGRNGDNLPLYPRRLINRLAHVQRLRKALAIRPGKLIADLKASVLDRAGHAVIGASARECDAVAARLKHAKVFGPKLGVLGDVATVPLFAHESSPSLRPHEWLAWTLWPRLGDVG